MRKTTYTVGDADKMDGKPPSLVKDFKMALNLADQPDRPENPKADPIHEGDRPSGSCGVASTRAVYLSSPDRDMLMNTPSGSPWESVSFHVNVDDGAVRVVRRAVMQLAGLLPFTKSDLDSIETAVGEAAMNAARHGSPYGDRNTIEVSCSNMEGCFSVRITDQGAGFRPDEINTPVAEALPLNGYGLSLMHALMDEIEFTTSCQGGTVVRLTKRYKDVV